MLCTGVTKERLVEAKEINKSLSALGDVISALSSGGAAQISSLLSGLALAAPRATATPSAPQLGTTVSGMFAFVQESPSFLTATTS